MAGVVEEIVTFLAAAGVGVDGTTLFRHTLPATPNACTAVIETGGVAPDRGFGSSDVRFESPAVQVLVRGEPRDFDTPRALAKTAWEALAGVEAPQELSGTAYNMITPLQQPFPLGKPDELHRPTIACNYLIEKEPTA